MYWVKPKPRPWVLGWRRREGVVDPEVPEGGKSCGFCLSFFFSLFRMERAGINAEAQLERQLNLNRVAATESYLLTLSIYS